MHILRSFAVCLGVSWLLGGLTLACSTPAPSAKPTPEAADAFAVVRATAAAAYQSGKTHLDRGEFLQACVDLDAAKLNDPDNRPEIQQALDRALEKCLTPVAEATTAPLAAQVPTIAVPTLAVAAPPTTGAPPKSGPPSTPPSTGKPTSSGAAPPTTGNPTSAGATPPTAANPTSAGAAPVPTWPGPPPGATSGGPTPQIPNLVAWNDPQGRFSVSVPSDWVKPSEPRSLFGTPIVEIRDPTGRADFDVAVDSASKTVSPELYAASMELAMQRQMPGYASEQVLPGSMAGNPSVRRVFTFAQRDANGQDHQARGFQVTIIRGSTPYIISGSAPAEQYPQYTPIFDRMLESFRFS